MADVAPLRWGILGTGGIARAFATDLAALPQAHLVAVGSRSARGAQAFGERFMVANRHASYAALANDPDVDIVYVATPHPFHAADALTVIAAGKHVLIEKPFTMDAEQARMVVAAARAAGVFCMEGMWTRFLPHVLRIRELLAEGALGELCSVAADHGQYFAPDAGHRLFAPELGGGALLDLGIYPVSWASMVSGAPNSVTAVSSPAFTGVDAQTSIVLGYSGGAQATLTTTLQARTPCRAWIAGTLGRIDVEPTFYAPSGFTFTRGTEVIEHFPASGGAAGADSGGKGLRFEAAEATRCVRAGLLESPGMPLDETVSIMTTLDEIRRQIGLTYPGENDRYSTP